MQVKDLINVLKKFDPELPVAFPCETIGYTEDLNPPIVMDLARIEVEEGWVELHNDSYDEIPLSEDRWIGLVFP